MTAIEFCKQFNCYIAFARSGEGKVFGLGIHPPVYVKEYDYWLYNKGGETTLLPFFIDDYDFYHKAHKKVLITPTSEPEKVKAVTTGEIPMTECHDFKNGDSVETNVEVKHFYGEPNLTTMDYEHSSYYITLTDGKHDFRYKTKIEPDFHEGDTFFLKAKVKQQIAQTDIDIPRYEVQGVKLLKAKK